MFHNNNYDISIPTTYMPICKGFYLGKQLSIAIQRGNLANILGTLPSGDGLVI